jgi:hypothetical protein
MYELPLGAAYPERLKVGEPSRLNSTKRRSPVNA